VRAEITPLEERAPASVHVNCVRVEGRMVDQVRHHPEGSDQERLPVGEEPREPASLNGKAEGEGFEPSTGLTTRNGFRDRRIRPLCHPSGSELKAASFEAEKEGFEPSREEITPLTP
jgi:hypothetical protein